MRGKPTEKRNYLESFFNIDSFYSNSFDVYNKKWKKVKDEIELLKGDRIRLEAINDARKDLPGEKWVDLQLEHSDTALSLLKDQITATTNSQAEIQKQLEAWSQYHALFTQLQGLDAKWLKDEQEKLMREKLELDRKAKNKLQLDTFLKLKLAPHQAKKPNRFTEKPVELKPDNKDITSKEIALNQMRDKLRLKKQITPLAKEILELEQQLALIPDLSTIDTNKASLYKKRMDADEHLKLLQKGGDACPTCKQPLSFILGEMNPQDKKRALEATIAALMEQEKECLQHISLHNKTTKLNQQLAVLQEQFDRFPTFGMKLSDAEMEVTTLKEVTTRWEAYDKEQDAEIKWHTTNDLLLVEAKNLGYPDILDENFSEDIQRISDRLPVVTEELKLFDRFDVLTETVLSLKNSSDLESQKQQDKAELTSLFSRVDELNEFKGVLRTQRTSIATLKAQAEVLEAKVAGQESTESECKILEIMNTFYSPTGFKVYELKKRCQNLIERANYWSSLFFQEAYVWSLSEDLDNLDFLIQPIHNEETEPYPIALLSSGEFNRAARVLLFSQLELIPPTKKTNLLFLDEIEGHLDEAGMTAFGEVVLPKLKETFPDHTIVIISHLGSLQKSGFLDHLWMAERKDRKTTLTTYLNYQRKLA